MLPKHACFSQTFIMDVDETSPRSVTPSHTEEIEISISTNDKGINMAILSTKEERDTQVQGDIAYNLYYTR